MDGGDSPQAQRASVDGLILVMVVMRVWASVKPGGGSGGGIIMTMRKWRSGSEPSVVHKPIDVGLGERGVKVGPFRVLAFSLVCVLVAT